MSHTPILTPLLPHFKADFNSRTGSVNSTTEPVFVNVYGDQESIPPAYAASRAGTTNRVVVPARQAGNRFLGSLKGLQIRAQVFMCCALSPARHHRGGHYTNVPAVIWHHLLLKASRFIPAHFGSTAVDVLVLGG